MVVKVSRLDLSGSISNIILSSFTWSKWSESCWISSLKSIKNLRSPIQRLIINRPQLGCGNHKIERLCYYWINLSTKESTRASSYFRIQWEQLCYHSFNAVGRKFILHTQDVGDPARHTGRKVPSSWPFQTFAFSNLNLKVSSLAHLLPCKQQGTF